MYPIVRLDVSDMKIWNYIFGILFLATIGTWLAVFATGDEELHLIACDVGQGDAILILLGSSQILVDGGPNNKVLSCLSKYMPFYDRQIELVVLTHPDADHSTGLVEVFRRYRVAAVLENNMEPKTEVHKELTAEIKNEGATIVNPKVGMVLRVGLIDLGILHPADDFQDTKTNNYSIVIHLKYKDFDALLTGDIENKVSDLVAERLALSGSRSVEYLKIPHHGSKNGLSEKLLDVVMPRIAVISAGKNNRYGHPHQEIIDMLNKFNLQILRTDQAGDIGVITDGKTIQIGR